MQCQNCHANIPDNASFCQFCGNPVNRAPQGMPNYNMPMTKEQFRKHPLCRKYTGNLIGACSILYFCAAVTLFSNVMLKGNIFCLLDFGMILGLTLAIHLARNLPCAIILCVYAGVNCLYFLVTRGFPGGWLVVVGAAYALTVIGLYRSSWSNYLRTGYIV